MSAVAVARGSSFIFSKQLLTGGMEPLNLLGICHTTGRAVPSYGDQGQYNCDTCAHEVGQDPHG